MIEPDLRPAQTPRPRRVGRSRVDRPCDRAGGDGRTGRRCRARRRPRRTRRSDWADDGCDADHLAPSRGTTTSLADAPSTTTALTGPPPLTFVVAGDGRFVALDTKTGDIVHELHTPSAGRWISNPRIAADGRVAYFSEIDATLDQTNDREPCHPVLYRADTSTGQVERVAEGVTGVESPDGRYLAYVANGVARGASTHSPLATRVV